MGDLSVNGASAAQGVAFQEPRSGETADTAGPLLPSPQTSLEPGSVLALVALLTKSHQQDRAQSKQQALIEEANIMKQAKARIAEMHARADDSLRAAWASGVSQIASGALTATGGVLKANAASKELGAQSDLAEAQAQAGASGAGQSAQVEEATAALNAAEAQSKWADGVSTVLQGSASGVSGAGAILKGEYEKAAEDHSIAAEEHQVQGDAADRRRQLLQDDVEKARDQIRAVIDFFREMNDADNKAKQSALFRG